MYDEILERFKKEISRGIYEFKTYGHEGTWKLKVVKYYPKDQGDYDLSNTSLMFLNENYPDYYSLSLASGGMTGGGIYTYRKDPNFIYEILDIEPEDFIIESYVNTYKTNIQLRKAMDLANSINFHASSYSFKVKFKASNGKEIDIEIFPFYQEFSHGKIIIKRVFRDIRIRDKNVPLKSYVKKRGLSEVFDAKKFLEIYQSSFDEFKDFTKKDAENLYNFVKNFVETVEIPEEIIKTLNWINENAEIKANEFSVELRNLIKKVA